MNTRISSANGNGARVVADTDAPGHARKVSNDCLRANTISFSYHSGGQRFEVFRDVSLEISRGEVLGLFGPNGTGKTTLMRALARLLPVNGEIHSPSLEGQPRRPRIGYVPQGYARSFYPWASLETNILMNLPNPVANAKANRQAVRDAHDALGLDLDLRRRPFQCSGGMIQQASLIRALARRPDILIADEPFSALDFDVAARVRDGFRRAVSEYAICAVLALHELQDIVEVCDLVMAIPGRPFTTNPRVATHFRAHIFRNEAGGEEVSSRSRHNIAPDDSPFISALRHALKAHQL